MDGFLFCPEHGDLWWQPDIYEHSIMTETSVIPLRDDLPSPVRGEEMLCPFCGRGLIGATRPTVTVLR